MSKDRKKATDFFIQNAQTPQAKQRFEEIEDGVDSGFAAKFITSPLTPEQDREIQLILADMCYPSDGVEEQVESDHKSLSDITTQIGAIDRQGVLLHGERIHKARDILKKYKDGAFTRWLGVAYKNRQTPYRILQYYEFFKSLGKDEQRYMQSMPLRAAYVLASRDGDQQKKVEIIKQHHLSSPDDIIQAVQDVFPLNASDRRKGRESDVVLVESLRATLLKIKKKNHLSNSAFEKLQELRELMDEICTQHR